MMRKIKSLRTMDMLTAATTPFALCIIAAIVQPFAPAWVMVALIGPALLLMWFRLVKIQRMWNDFIDPVNEEADEADRDCD